MENRPREVIVYKAANGFSPFDHWLKSLKDPIAHAAIQRRIKRVEQGNFGDCERYGAITELRLHIGPGYRVYMGQDGPVLVIVVGGGDKSSQKKDFLRAKEIWDEYQTRKNF